MKFASEVIDNHFSAIVTVLQSILGFLQILDVLRIPYFPTINRITISKNFKLNQNLVLPLLLLLGLSIAYEVIKRQQKIGLMPLISFFLYPIYGIEPTLSIATTISVIITIYANREYKKLLFWSFLIFSGINGLSFIHWAFLTPLNLKTPVESLALLELDVFYIASYLAPLIATPLLFIWLVKQLLAWAWDSKFEGYMPHPRILDNNKIYLLLSSAILLSIISAIYPYLSNINPNYINVGVDIQSYVKWSKLIDNDISQAFNANAGYRPLIYLIIVTIKRLSSSNYTTIVRYLPALLNPLLVISVYFLTHEAFQDPWTASWASFFTACGYQITVNMYSYYLTNILGLSLIFLSLGFLLRTLRNDDRNSLFAASILGSLLVFTHPWTLNQYIATVIVSTIISYNIHRKEGREQNYLKPMVSYLAVLIVTELLKSYLFKGFGVVDAATTAISSSISPAKLWVSSIFTFRLRYGGFMSNVYLLGLATIGAYLINIRKIHERLLTILLSLTSILFLIGNEAIKSRLFFNIPIGIFAALGFLSIFQRLEDQNLKQTFTIFSVSSMLAYLFQSLANLI